MDSLPVAGYVVAELFFGCDTQVSCANRYTRVAGSASALRKYTDTRVSRLRPNTPRSTNLGRAYGGEPRLAPTGRSWSGHLQTTSMPGNVADHVDRNLIACEKVP